MRQLTGIDCTHPRGAHSKSRVPLWSGFLAHLVRPPSASQPCSHPGGRRHPRFVRAVLETVLDICLGHMHALEKLVRAAVKPEDRAVERTREPSPRHR